MMKPSVSIVMPVRNESAYIQRCIKAIIDQDYPSGKLEVIIADGMSTDDTREIIHRVLSKNGQFQIHLIDNKGYIVPTGLNAALTIAKGDIVIRVDGHCEIESDYVSKCVKYITEMKADGVGGPIETIGETPLSESIAVAMSSKFGVGGSAFRTVKDKSMLVDTVAFPAYTRAIIEKAGPYDEELVRNQDDEYNYRIRKMGGKILLASDIRSKYYSRGSLGKLWKQYFQYGYWKVRVLQKHPRQMSLRQFVPPAFVFALIVSSLLALVSISGQWLFALVAGSYIAANITASTLTAKNNGWQHLLRLPIIFAILHLAYGSGFLVGLVKFAGRWKQA